MADSEPTPPAPPALTGDALWLARLRRCGQAGLTICLVTIIGFWVHEVFFVAPEVRQAWKLRVLLVLIPIALLSALTLLIVWVLEKVKIFKARQG
ncbi:MAG: hypothetical protein EBS05_18530 [Proteobacteria bacterium]|nr:hypothetical protein [Pseudomonadota bacterium]